MAARVSQLPVTAPDWPSPCLADLSAALGFSLYRRGPEWQGDSGEGTGSQRRLRGRARLWQEARRKGEEAG